MYDVLVLKETPFKKSGSTSMPGELPELFPFPKNKTEHENSTAATWQETSGGRLLSLYQSMREKLPVAGSLACLYSLYIIVGL